MIDAFHVDDSILLKAINNKWEVNAYLLLRIAARFSKQRASDGNNITLIAETELYLQVVTISFKAWIHYKYRAINIIIVFF